MRASGLQWVPPVAPLPQFFGTVSPWNGDRATTRDKWKEPGSNGMRVPQLVGLPWVPHQGPNVKKSQPQSIRRPQDIKMKNQTLQKPQPSQMADQRKKMYSGINREESGCMQ